MKRDLKKTMLHVIIEESKKHHIDTIIGNYYPTSKNAMVKDFYQTMGFEKISEDNEGNSKWSLKVSEYSGKIKHMEVDCNL